MVLGASASLPPSGHLLSCCSLLACAPAFGFDSVSARGFASLLPHAGPRAAVSTLGGTLKPHLLLPPSTSRPLSIQQVEQDRDTKGTLQPVRGPRLPRTAAWRYGTPARCAVEHWALDLVEKRCYARRGRMPRQSLVEGSDRCAKKKTLRPGTRLEMSPSMGPAKGPPSPYGHPWAGCWACQSVNPGQARHARGARDRIGGGGVEVIIVVVFVVGGWA